LKSKITDIIIKESVMKNIFSKSRVETFSDGIFAIIITLLVLEIKVPHINEVHSSEELGKSLIGLLPKIISWMISFFTIAVIWVNHHKIFKQVKVLDAGIFWWNAVLLLWSTLIPFPTAVLGDYPVNKMSIILYGIEMSLMAASFSFMRFYAIRKQGLLEESVDMGLFRKGTYYSVLFGPVMYLTGVALGLIHPYLAFVIFIGIPVYFIFSETKN
jgi:uncharacterized membrane protein